MSNTAATRVEPELSVTVIGCSGSFPGPDSPASCYLLRSHRAGQQWRVVMDLGSGALGALQRHIDPMVIDAVVLSHLHPDHCLDLTGLHVMRTHHPVHPRPAPLDVFAPSGAAERLARAHGVAEAKEVTDTFAFTDLTDRTSFTVGPMRITPFAVNHPVAAFGFRVECGAVTLAYTGDTDTCEALSPLMADADLVLADSASVEGRDTVAGIHLSGARAARAATEAGGVKRLVLTHIPAWNDPEVCRAQAQQEWAGTVELARADVTIHLPSDSRHET